jgi:hypothetical protein
MGAGDPLPGHDERPRRHEHSYPGHILLVYVTSGLHHLRESQTGKLATWSNRMVQVSSTVLSYPGVQPVREAQALVDTLTAHGFSSNFGGPLGQGSGMVMVTPLYSVRSS